MSIDNILGIPILNLLPEKATPFVIQEIDKAQEENCHCAIIQLEVILDPSPTIINVGVSAERMLPWPSPSDDDNIIIEEPPPQQDTSGYVYILSGGGFYKIGRATDIDRRITQIKPKLPFEVTLAHVIQSRNCLELEAGLHKRFADKRTNGEWFTLTEEDVTWLKTL